MKQACSPSRFARQGLADLEVYPEEIVAIVVTALALNAFTYGAIFQLNGVANPLTTLLLVGGGAVGLGAAVWLVVIYHVQQVVNG